MVFLRRTVLANAMAACESQVDSDVWDQEVVKNEQYRLDDNNQTLYMRFSFVNENDPNDIAGCLFQQLHMPGSMRAKMYATKNLDGMVSGSWDNFNATWSYSDGMTVIIETK